MRITYCSETFIVVNLLLLYESQPLLDSSGVMAFLCLLIILVTLWERDFSPFLKAKGFRSKLSALKKRLLNQEALRVDESLWADEALWAGEPPSFVDIAKRLIKALPASDRSEAYRLLVTQFLPEEWASADSLRAPPQLTLVTPMLLFEKRVKGLANELQQAPENQRLHLLRADLCQSQIGHLSFNATMLAMARYMHEHPDATPKRKTYWLDFEELASFTAMSIPELEDKASEVLEQVAQWDKLAQLNHPDIWEHDKLTPFEIQVNLDSAYSGSFHVAMGDFASFLSLVGAEFERIRLSNG